jgi:hypothetical protein
MEVKMLYGIDIISLKNMLRKMIRDGGNEGEIKNTMQMCLEGAQREEREYQESLKIEEQRNQYFKKYGITK